MDDLVKGCERYTWSDDMPGSPKGNRLSDMTEPMSPGALAGEVFCFTGSLSVTRNEARALVARAGGALSDTVNIGTKFLVVGDKPGLKLKQAKRIGVSCITEGEFMKLVSRKTWNPYIIRNKQIRVDPLAQKLDLD